MSDNKSSVFISHAYADQDWTNAFAHSLQSHGQKVWIDTKSIAVGDQLRHAIETALRESTVIVLVVSSNSIHNPNVFFELGAALSMGKRVIPIVSKDFDLATLPAALRNRNYLVKGTPEETAEQLLQGMTV